ncbi:hypothetical protein [Marinobacter zhanjiangensis]|uniref:hypothetical protein n=1 Tax=Marinobacter zhanjiangensis TaxID=578215 RepID=UPI00167A5E1C|nr:hypothetical protein [Marinobacter zhanjiangensis]
MSHILTDNTERAKRNLLLFSALCFFLNHLGELPGRIPLLDIPLDVADRQQSVAQAFLFVQIYFLTRFSALCWVDSVNWLAQLDKSQYPDHSRLSVADSSFFEVLKRFAQTYYNERSKVKLAFVGSLNQTMEVVIPLGVGVIGLWAAFSLVSVG